MSVKSPGKENAEVPERILVQGNEAIGWGAIGAGCRHFFGYPITPQNEITEFFARELPEIGGEFVQSESEAASAAMLYGAAAAGVRAITSTSGAGWGLMQEGMSQLANAELPCVVVNMQRGGPGQGTTRHAQMDYLSATRGGGQGGYKILVLAPASVQECHDLVQMAFHLADRYRNPVVVLGDGILGQMAEPLEVKTIEFGPLPEKDWTIRGVGERGASTRNFISCGQGGVIPLPPYPSYAAFLLRLEEKYNAMTATEVRYEEYRADDASLLLVAYGSTARVCQEAVDAARTEGLRVGLLRLVTLWPFPIQIIRERASAGSRFLVVEDSLGQMVDDVRFAVEGRSQVHFLGVLARHLPTDGGMILPDRVLEEIKKVS